MPAVESELSAPLTVDRLWLTQGKGPPARPLMQGDIFEKIPSELGGIVMVVSHPCSMRTGSKLRPRLTVVKIESIKSPNNDSEWQQGYYDYVPLSGLSHSSLGRGYPVANFRLISSVETESLVTEKRIAVLSYEGILLLQQRLAHHLTRAIIDLPTLAKVSEAVFIEVDLQEEWVERATMGLYPSDLGEAVKNAEARFQELLDEKDRRLRGMLGDDQTRPTATREIRKLITDGAPSR